MAFPGVPVQTREIKTDMQSLNPTTELLNVFDQKSRIVGTMQQPVIFSLNDNATVAVDKARYSV